MPRYDRIYETLAERAIRRGAIDIESFVEQAINSGMSLERAQDALLSDLETGGPIFGQFVRGLTGAAEKSVGAAFRQGQRGGEIEADKHLQRLLKISKTEGSLLSKALDDADADALADVEKGLGTVVEYMWVAELVKTCHRCLPLHGKVRTLDEWQSLGLHPDSIHDDWHSSCHCVLVKQSDTTIRERNKAIQPLVRAYVAEVDKEAVGGKKKFRATQRALTQLDVDRANKARDEAMKSAEGRKILRLLGEAGMDDLED